jgi:hypothetical protein
MTSQLSSYFFHQLIPNQTSDRQLSNLRIITADYHIMSDRTVLVTGATGLLGREVSAAFGLKNWEVKGTGLSRADGISTFKVDLGNENEVTNFLDDTKPKVIVHCKSLCSSWPI